MAIRIQAHSQASAVKYRPFKTTMNKRKPPRIPLRVLQHFLMMTFLVVSMVMMIRMDRLLDAAMMFDSGSDTASLRTFATSPNNNSFLVDQRRSMSGFDTDDLLAEDGGLSALSSWLSSATIEDSTDNTPLSDFAYMFLIGGIDPSTSSYRGFLYNVLIATYLLRQNGSTSDIVLFLQMASNSTMNTLPANEEKQLNDLDIKYRYMDKPKHDTFSHVIMEKFQILTLTEYQRVIFLDADVLPVVNLDYYMELSMQGVFQPNAIVATKAEPANAGLFMVAPQEGDYAALQQIIKNQQERDKNMGYPFFDKIRGWGHNFIAEKDKWEGTERHGIKWGFWCAHVDQGLLYYWTKYYKKAVTIFLGNEIQQWANGTDGKAYLRETLNPLNITAKYAQNQTRSTTLHNCHRKQHPNNYNCKMPYQDYKHYTGKGKPWQQGFDSKKLVPSVMWYYGIWFNTLFEASIKYGWNITKDNVNDRVQGESPLGYVSKFFHRAESEHNWTDTKS